MLPALPVTLYPSKKKAAFALPVCAAFTVAGIVLAPSEPVLGWLCAGFFGLGLLIGVLKFFGNSTYLRLTEEGLELRSLYRLTRYRWSDLAGFGTYEIRHNGIPTGTFVGLNFSPQYQQSRAGRAIARAFAGYDGSLPDTFGLGAEELATLLARLQAAQLAKAA